MNIEELRASVKDRMKPSRYEHSLATSELAVKLARRYGEDEERVIVASLLHDIRKDSAIPGNNLSHGPEAALIAKSEYGIIDEDILNAIRYHTTGRADMSKLELIVFLADTLEPGRSYDRVDELRGLVYEDLYGGALAVLEELALYLEANGFRVSKDSLEAIAWLKGRKSCT